MSGELVNLRRARKARAKLAADQAAAANRALFGRSKGERAAAASEKARVENIVAGARLDPASRKAD